MSGDSLLYAFGHLVASYDTDAHAGDSGDLARDIFDDLQLSFETVTVLETVAEFVAGNYTYHGEAEALLRRIKAGEV